MSSYITFIIRSPSLSLQVCDEPPYRALVSTTDFFGLSDLSKVRLVQTLDLEGPYWNRRDQQRIPGQEGRNLRWNNWTSHKVRGCLMTFRVLRVDHYILRRKDGPLEWSPITVRVTGETLVVVFDPDNKIENKNGIMSLLLCLLDLVIWRKDTDLICNGWLVELLGLLNVCHKICSVRDQLVLTVYFRSLVLYYHWPIRLVGPLQPEEGEGSTDGHLKIFRHCFYYFITLWFRTTITCCILVSDIEEINHGVVDCVCVFFYVSFSSTLYKSVSYLLILK